MAQALTLMDRLPQRSETVVQRAQSGDVKAFESLYREHSPRVYALCRRLCADEELAQNLTQEAFVKAWQKLGSFRGDAAFGTWMHRLGVNTVLNERRARQRRTARELAVAQVESTTEPTQRADAGMDLDRAIASLPSGARTVFVLHAIEGYKHEEIADLMETSVGTSKAQLHRARALLRKVLG